MPNFVNLLSLACSEQITRSTNPFTITFAPQIELKLKVE